MPSMFENRLRKNLARLGPWAKREQIDAYRLYDLDVPEFPYAVDCYADHVLVSEFVTPRARRQSDEERAHEHDAVVAEVLAVTGVEPEKVVFKQRVRHRAVERQAAGRASHEFAVREHGLTFLVNLDDYLDTGLFLDHRTARRRLGKAAAGKRVLNLFCYTGGFTVHAAAGGAQLTESVDLSATYLAWAERNLHANGLDGPAHRLVRADVFEHLRRSRDTFDLVVLDPPTTSRSKTGHGFEIQRAHPELIALALARLAPGGTLLFSTNDRRFALETARLPPCDIREVTDATTPQDFREGRHRAFEIRRAD
ncbi:MAG: rRNA m(2)G2445 methyltransferase [Pseudomonadota bacterium]|jgi:23S rRNA G2069 N7-methylase RlmK/C1962 C5-methylase RlmI